MKQLLKAFTQEDHIRKSLCRFPYQTIQIIVFGFGFLFMFPVQAQDENDRFSLSVATEAGNSIIWRINRYSGAVSLCEIARFQNLTCSPWSSGAKKTDRARYRIGASFSRVNTFRAWRLDAATGQVSFCSIGGFTKLLTRLPTCSPWAK